MWFCNPLIIIFLLSFLCGATESSEPTKPKKSEPQSVESGLHQNESKTQQAPTSKALTVPQSPESVPDGNTTSEQTPKKETQSSPPRDSVWWFNLFIVIFTGCLVVVGGLQVRVYWRQARYMRHGLSLTREAIDLAKINADILIRHNAPFIRFVSAELEYGSSARPNEPPVFYTLQNYGDGRGFLTKIANESLLTEESLPDVPTYRRVTHYRLSEITLDRMEKIPVPLILPSEIGDVSDLYGKLSRGKSFFVYGFIKCSDVLRQIHVFGFGYELIKYRFVMAGGETYNYYRCEKPN